MRTKAELLAALSDPHHDARLTAVRELSEMVGPTDLEALTQARAKETVYWVRRALDDTVARLTGARDLSEPLATSDDLTQRLEEESYSRALEDIASQLSHEFSPLIGAVDYQASKEVSGYAESDTARAVERLRSALGAIKSLSQAASAPAYSEFALGEVLRNIVETEQHKGMIVTYSGRDELVVRGDESLVDLAVSNGFRNAIDATEALGDPEMGTRPVLVAWGQTDIDYWVSVRDQGCGLPTSYTRAFELGVTNKPHHMGMGLAIAQRAATSLGGTVRLRPGREGGTLFELRWPRAGAGDEDSATRE